MDAQQHDKEVRAKLARKQEAAPDADTPAPAKHPVIDLQRMIGNKGVQRLLAQRKLTAAPNGAVQTKLTVGAPDDVYEQEADSVAHQVMTMPDKVQREEAPEDEELAMKRVQREELPEDEELAMKRIQRDAAPEEEELAMKRIQRDAAPEEELMMKSATGDVPDVSDDTESQIESMRGGGHSMPDNTRGFFESRFGQDFSGVNIHTGAQADSLNRSLEARAFTTGSDIFFRNGEYNPDSSGGRELLAHELTHVVQQGGSQAQRKTEDCDNC
jgi:hypothetical protein